MRTTLNLDDDVLERARELARDRGTTLGDELSALARFALENGGRSQRIRNGVPLLPHRKGARRVTPEMVRRLLDED